MANTGGPAFPFEFKGREGMTLRDYFAAKAMQGLVAHGGCSATTADLLAEWSYRIADGMLAARET